MKKAIVTTIFGPARAARDREKGGAIQSHDTIETRSSNKIDSEKRYGTFGGASKEQKSENNDRATTNNNETRMGARCAGSSKSLCAHIGNHTIRKMDKSPTRQTEGFV